MSSELFYDTLDQLHQRQDTDAREETTKKKRKRPKNPILPDGTVKRGRPRKDQPGTSKRKREDIVEDGQSCPSKKAKTAAPTGNEVVEASQGTPVAEPAPRKRGRPPKRKPEGEPPATPTPRKRGRPRKTRTPAIPGEQETQGGVEQPLPKAFPSVPSQEAVPEITRDEAELPVPPYPEALEQQAQQGAGTDTLHPTGDPHPTPQAEHRLIAAEPREAVQKNQQDTDRVRRSCSVPMQFTNTLSGFGKRSHRTAHSDKYDKAPRRTKETQCVSCTSRQRVLSGNPGVWGNSHRQRQGVCRCSRCPPWYVGRSSRDGECASRDQSGSEDDRCDVFQA